MDQKGILHKLEQSLLTEEEYALGKEAWAEYEDPFPEWEIQMSDESDDEGIHEDEMPDNDQQTHHGH